LNDELLLSLITETELRRIISEGRSGTLMPAFGTASGGQLTIEQVAILAAGLKENWSGHPGPKVVPPYLLAAGGTGNAAAGTKVFARACACCHGEDGQGGRSGGKDGQEVGAIHDSDFLALTSVQALRRYVITGRPDLGMPNFADPAGRPEGFTSLTKQDVADVVALLASWKNDSAVSGKGRE
jgi:mono/diheme cytochrome c family protein